MATTEMESNSERSRESSSRPGSGTRSLRDVASNAMNTDTLIDIVQRLGLVDIAVNSLRSRLEASDVDEMIDDAVDYLRRNPEIIVVALGAITVAAGVVVFLADRDDDYEDDYESEPRPRRSSSTRRSAASSQRDDVDVTPEIGGGSTSSRSTGGSRSRTRTR